jgi:copper chaperone CopZ
LLIAGVISGAVPRNYFADVVPPGLLQILVLMALGIPVYVCATASIPLAYALILSGVSPGAALAFLMTGPATNAATITTIWKVMGRRTTVIYLATMIVGALIGGLLLDRLVTGDDIVGGRAIAWMLPVAVKHVSAALLLVVLAIAVAHPWVSRFRKPKGAPPGAMELKVGGMTCTVCASSVRRALLDCPGVESARVDLERGTATVMGAEADLDILATAVQELGYRVERGLERKGEHDG